MIMKRIRKSTNFKYILVSETAKLDFKWIQLQIYNVYILSGHCKITLVVGSLDVLEVFSVNAKYV